MTNSGIPILTLVKQSGSFALFILFIISALSILCWAVILRKILAYKKAKENNKAFIRQFNKRDSLKDVIMRKDFESFTPMENICRTGILEFERLLKSAISKGEKIKSIFVQSQFEIIRDHLDKSASEEAQRSEQHLIFLAITASASPFLGLLGTVWGIMNAFIEIGNQASASLNVVAPGIAEALVTTIWGISVAIPAVVSYNLFISKCRTYEDNYYNFSNVLLNRIKSEFFDLIDEKSITVQESSKIDSVKN